MSDHDLKPPTEETYVEKLLKERKSKTFAKDLFDRIVTALESFEFEYDKAANIAKHIVNSDVEQALEDCTPLFVWFTMCANKAEERKEYYEDNLKTILMSNIKEGKTVSEKKGEARTSKVYKDCHAAYRKYKMISKNCEGLAKAMQMRANLTQTKSANVRPKGMGYSVMETK